MSTVELILRFCGAALAGYLLGSLPSGVLVGKLFGDVDPRTHGSGKTGATNVLRTLGLGPALLVALLDAAKGAGAVLLARYLFFHSGATAGAVDYRGFAEALAGFMALLGHNYSVFIRFIGGRGVMTGAGAMLLMSPLATLIAFIGTILPIAITRYVSLGSILGAAIGILAGAVLLRTPFNTFPHWCYFLAGGLFIIISHRDNIQRLLAGTERKLGQPAE